MYHIVNLHSQYVLFTFFYPLFFSCYVHCTAVYTVCCPVHSCSLTVVLPERTIYSHFVYFSSKVGLLAEIGTPHLVGNDKNRHFNSYKNLNIFLFKFLRGPGFFGFFSIIIFPGYCRTNKIGAYCN